VLVVEGHVALGRNYFGSFLIVVQVGRVDDVGRRFVVRLVRQVRLLGNVVWVEVGGRLVGHLAN
jgi:hypothetical protein